MTGVTTDDANGSEKGPLQVRNRFPPHLMFLTPMPDSPRVLKKNSIEAAFSMDYTSLYAHHVAEEWAVLMDMEMLVLDFSLAWGVTDALDLSVDVPLIQMSDGFLDRFLENYHGMFGFPNYGKEERPYDEFAYHIQKEDQDWFEADPGKFYLGETVLSAKLRLVGPKQNRHFNSSLAYAIKLPTGDEKRGFGSGRIDQVITLLTQFRFAPVVLYLNPGYIFLADPKTLGPEVSVDDIFTMLAGIEFEVGEKWSLLAQVNTYTSMFKDTGVPHLDQDSTELALGFSVQVSNRMNLEFAFCEDLTRAAPDFTVHTRLSYVFGNRP